MRTTPQAVRKPQAVRVERHGTSRLSPPIQPITTFPRRLGLSAAQTRRLRDRVLLILAAIGALAIVRELI